MLFFAMMVYMSHGKGNKFNVQKPTKCVICSHVFMPRDTLVNNGNKTANLPREKSFGS